MPVVMKTTMLLYWDVDEMKLYFCALKKLRQNLQVMQPKIPKIQQYLELKQDILIWHSY